MNPTWQGAKQGLSALLRGRDMHGKGPVLVIDDDPMISEAIGALLRRDGVDVRLCADGESALDAVREKCYPVIITDYRMPGMSGTDITRLLRAQCPDTFIIGLSAEQKSSDFLKAGANAFLNKPFMPNKLLSLIQAFLRN
jgi:two-component system response regulator MtrA